MEIKKGMDQFKITIQNEDQFKIDTSIIKDQNNEMRVYSYLPVNKCSIKLGYTCRPL